MAQGRILVVEAEPSVAGPLRAVLRDEGYTVQVASSGGRALIIAGESEWDLALLSLVLPRAGGHELVTVLRERRPGLSVIVLTPPEGRTQGFAARAAGAYAFLEVPQDLTREKVLTAVANALEHRSLLAQVAAARAAVPATLNLEERERQAIREALEASRWNKQAAARLLGLHRPTLYAKMRKHGIPQKRPV